MMASSSTPSNQSNSAVESQGCVIVGVAGGSGGGKTYFARELVATAQGSDDLDCLVSHITLDSYYNCSSGLTDEEKAVRNYDHPQSIDFPLLTKHLQLLRAGQSVEVPVYSFVSHTRTAESQLVLPTGLLVVEGILALHDPTVREHFDFSIFVDAPDEVRLARRMERDIEERGRTKECVQSQWQATVLPMHREFVQPSSAHATRQISGQDDHRGTIDGVIQKVQQKFLG